MFSGRILGYIFSFGQGKLLSQSVYLPPFLSPLQIWHISGAAALFERNVQWRLLELCHQAFLLYHLALVVRPESFGSLYKMF